MTDKAANNLEQQALESIEPLMLPTCRGIPIESNVLSKVNNKFRGISKSPKSAKKSPVQAGKQKMLKDDFREDDSLGTISSKGQLLCPKCNIFETRNVDCFRDHLYKDINYKR